MKFADFLNQAWRDHAAQSKEVAERFTMGIDLIESQDQIPSMAALITHVMGEHLGEWDGGVKALEKLRSHSLIQPESEGAIALQRSIAILNLGAGNLEALEASSKSDQVRILATASSALCQQNEVQRASEYFKRSLEIAENHLTNEDPAIRALAITSNNLACALEEYAERTQAETELMVLAAISARKYWEVAGTWMETERAEYRLSQTYVKANDLDQALLHAKMCLEISQRNHAPPLELFFAHEAVCSVTTAMGRVEEREMDLQQMTAQFKCLNLEDQSWCEASLAKWTR